jgi:uncharacterized small protein (DUF1192 family)
MEPICRIAVDSMAPPDDLPPMDLDELFPDKPKDPLSELTKQDLGPLSIDELNARIEALKGEIARVEAHMAAAEQHLKAADELFNKKP